MKNIYFRSLFKKIAVLSYTVVIISLMTSLQTYAAYVSENSLQIVGVAYAKNCTAINRKGLSDIAKTDGYSRADAQCYPQKAEMISEWLLNIDCSAGDIHVSVTAQFNCSGSVAPIGTFYVTGYHPINLDEIKHEADHKCNGTAIANGNPETSCHGGFGETACLTYFPFICNY